MDTIKVSVCVGTSCHLMGTQDILLALEKAKAELPVQLEIEYVSCLGRCGQGPNVQINGRPVMRATAELVLEMLHKLSELQTQEG